MPDPLRTLPGIFNYLEVVLWPAMGLILAIHGLRRRGAVRRDCLLAAVVLVAFGASDWFEANTGNEWWHPWWLLLWKAACVLALLSLVTLAWRRQRRLEGSAPRTGGRSVRDADPTNPPPAFDRKSPTSDQ
jgi:peptidoglycan/LPS O-acetylase OafA/YrhL